VESKSAVKKEKIKSLIAVIVSVILALIIYEFRTVVPTAEALITAAVAVIIHATLSFFGVMSLWGKKKT
jgi:uncharacterized membrane protein